MPFCKNCGRPLAENEVCNCTANQNNTSVYQTPPPPPPPPQQVNPQPQNFNSVPPVQPYQPPKKKSGAAPIIIVIVIILLVLVLIVGAVLAAILVPAMVGYTKKSKVQAQNANARSILLAVNSSLVDMEIQDYAVGGTFIISSESSGTFIIENNYREGQIPFDADVLLHKVENYYSDINLHEWFVVIKNGEATYVGSSDSWHSSYTGTYPPADYREGPQFYGDSYKKDSNADLMDLYDWAFDRLRY